VLMGNPSKLTVPEMDQNFRACGSHWLHATAGEERIEIALLFGGWTLAWMCLWVACSALAHMLIMPWLPPSTKKHENRATYIGQKIVATIKCALVAGLCNVGLYDLWHAPPAAFYTGHLLIEISGVHFTSFEIADLVLSGYLGILDPLHIAHHAIHITMGFIIRGHCAPVVTAATLMAQETSGLFLNYYLGMRNRLPSHWTILTSQALFALSFFIWRNAIGTWGTYVYLMRPDIVPKPASFNAPTDACLAAALCLASVLQWYWGVEIVRSALRRKAKSGEQSAKGA